MARVAVERISGTPNIHLYTNAAASATTYDAGELVGLNSSGLLVIGAAANILGIVQVDSPNSTSTEVPVDVISLDDSEFSMFYTASGTSAATDQGVKFAGDYTTGSQTVGSAGANGVIILGPDPRTGWGVDSATARKRVIVKFTSTAIVSNVGQ